MPKLHLHNLSLGVMARKLYHSLECQQKEARMVEAFREEGCLNDIALNGLYSAVKHSAPSERAQILIAVDFQQTLANWLYQDEIAAGGLEKALSPRSQQQMIELIDIIITFAAESPELMQEVLLISQNILTCFYKVVERSEDPLLRGRYLDCISKIFRVKPDVFNIAIYAEMLSITPDKVEEFYEFLDFYLLQRESQQAETVRFIMEGFSKRMHMFAEKPLLTKVERRGIIKAYIKLLEYLKNHLQTTLPERVLNQHADIFENLKCFVTREFNHHELSKVFNMLVYVYMNSRVNNVYKFEFLLGIYKHILLKSASLFSFLTTDTLSGEDFLAWLFSTELCYQRGKQVLECYLKNCASLEFLMVMTIYYLSHFPQRANEIASYMNWIGLLEEAKCFLHRDLIKEYFQIYYGLINQREYFDDFVNRIEDRAHRLIV